MEAVGYNYVSDAAQVSALAKSRLRPSVLLFTRKPFIEHLFEVSNGAARFVGQSTSNIYL